MKVSPDFVFHCFPVGPLQCNCSIIGDSASGTALVIDPGGSAEKILKILRDEELQLVAIIHTHAHLDHVLAAGIIREATGAPIYLHKSDRFLWDMLEQQCAMYGVPFHGMPDPDRPIVDDQALDCCGGVAIHTPGHTPGSTSFWFENHNLLIAGDTLFQGSIGRTDFPGGSFEQIVQSIRERLYKLDEEATVITGHGPSTTIGMEKTGNMFVRA